MSINYIVSLLYVAALTFIYIVSRKWRLAIFFLLFLGAPPFLDYELALVAPVALRLSPSLSIRPEITQPIVSSFDIFLVISIFIGLAEIKKKPRISMPKWYSLIVTSLVLIGIAASSIAIFLSENKSTAIAGLISVLRIPIVIITVANCFYYCIDKKETIIGIVVSIALFATQSLYITWIKSGQTIDFTRNQMTGLIPGPGATGSIFILILPLLIMLSLSVKIKWLKHGLRLNALIGVTFIILAYTRSVLFGLIIEILMIMIITVRHMTKKKRIRAFSFYLVVVSISLILLSNSPGFFQNKVRSSFELAVEDRINLEKRLVYWDKALNLIKENWLFGIGPLMWGMHDIGYGTTAHNAYLQYGAENGVIGAIIFVYLIGRLATEKVKKLIIAANTYHSHIAWDVGIFTGLSGFLVTQIFSNSLSHFRVAAIFWLMITIVVLINGNKIGVHIPKIIEPEKCNKVASKNISEINYVRPV